MKIVFQLLGQYKRMKISNQNFRITLKNVTKKRKEKHDENKKEKKIKINNQKIK